MRLIVDSNRIIAALIKESGVRYILLSPEFEFFAPDHLLLEIRNHVGEIIRKSKLSEDEFHVIFNILIERINIIPRSEIEIYVDEAKKIINDIDSDDVPFIALALTVPNDGIWTEDKHFKKQNQIKIWNTSDLMQILMK